MLSREVMPLLAGLQRQNTPGQDLSIATTTILEDSTFTSWSLLREGRGGGSKGREGEGESGDGREGREGKGEERMGKGRGGGEEREGREGRGRKTEKEEEREEREKERGRRESTFTDSLSWLAGRK